MERQTTFAQAAQAPTNGASNAEDFQPPTRNPQPTTPRELQPGGAQSQSAGGLELLTNPNATISITKNPAEGGATTSATPDGINWVFVIVASAVIVLAAELFFRRRERNKASLVTTATASTEALEEEAIGNMPDVPPPSKTKFGKKKSKSKRKNK